MTYLKLKSNPFPGVKSFDDYFNDFFKPTTPFFKEGFNLPPVNVSETKDQFTIELSAPGRSKGDFNIHMEGNQLEISSEQKEENKTEEKNYTRMEFKSSSFSRSFTLPESVNAEKISAEYANGILSVILPKKEESKIQGPKKISVD